MNQSIEYGKPLFTSGVFGIANAQDDLGLEEVGAGLLRRLIPGVIQNTPNAGYYSFYPYLLWKWEQLGGSVDRDSFVPFYRRHEAAFAVASAIHEHRDGFSPKGINGAIAARQVAREIEAGAKQVDLDALAASYMDTRLGGYGLFYAAALQDARLVRLGDRGLVDRAYDQGEVVAAAFAEAFESTSYAQEYFECDGPVPVEVIAELGEAVCLCTIPDRSDHKPLLDTFFGTRLEDVEWETRRLQRVGSLALLLEFHKQRPAAVNGDLAEWRRTLLEPRYSDGSTWNPSDMARWNSWRAYQLREVSVLALTTIWSIYLDELGRFGRATHAELSTSLTSWLDQTRLGFSPDERLRNAIEVADEQLPTIQDVLEETEALQSEWRDSRERSLCRAFRALILFPRETSRQADGFTELLDEGGRQRWSLEFLSQWMTARLDNSVRDVFSDLLEDLHFQHYRVAVSKIRTPSATNLRRNKGGWRDPFNFAEDDGVLRPLRGDEPFWTGARFDVGNHLLWTLGLQSAPDSDIRLTDLGLAVLDESVKGA